MAKSREHKRDIPVFYVGSRSVTEPALIMGTESYTSVNVNGAIRKNLVADVPLSFTPEFVEDGMMKTYCSDTASNRKALIALAQANLVLVPEEFMIKWEKEAKASAAPAEDEDTVIEDIEGMEDADLSTLTNKQLFDMAQKAGLEPSASWNKATLLKRIQEAK